MSDRINELADKVKGQLRAMGWCFVKTKSKSMWIKLYPPPHEVKDGHLPKVWRKLSQIGHYGDPVWHRDVGRAKVLIAEEG